MAHALRYLIAAVLAIGAGLLAPVRAASAEQAVRFTVFASRTASGLMFTPRPGQPTAPIVGYPTARSPRYEYRGPMPLRFRTRRAVRSSRRSRCRRRSRMPCCYSCR